MTYNETEMIDKLHAIKALGVHIALDDFGMRQIIFGLFASFAAG
ncbi:MAG: hypothetical protein U5K75_03170 [Ahrensia sp.]|nr:hypothetical protein [Ahrensia sp.]